VQVVQCKLDEKLDESYLQSFLDAAVDKVGYDYNRCSGYHAPGQTFEDTADVGLFVYGFAHGVVADDKWTKI